MEDIKIYGKLNRVTADDDGRSPIVDISQVDGLPINDSGSTQRIWVASSRALSGSDGQKRPSVKIGEVSFDKTPTLVKFEHDSTKYSAKISNIDELSYANVYPWNYTFAGVLARVTELYEMNPQSVEAVVSGKKVTFYWTEEAYVKRVTAETGGNGAALSTSAGPSVGIITKINYFNKWKNGDINADCPLVGSLTDDTIAKKYYAYIKSRYKWIVVDGNPVDVSTLYPDGYTETCGIENFEYFHKLTIDENGQVTKFDSKNADNKFYFNIFMASENDEPYSHTIAVRDEEGKLVVEDGSANFHAVNRRQLNALDAKLSNNIIAIENRGYISYSFTGPKGSWYTIAKAPRGQYTNSVFRLVIGVGSATTQAVCNVSELEYDAKESSISMISYDSRSSKAFTKMRILSNKTGTASASRVDSSLQIFIPGDSSNTATINVHIQIDKNNKYGGAFCPWTLVQPKTITDLQSQLDKETVEVMQQELQNQIASGTPIPIYSQDDAALHTNLNVACLSDLSTAPILGKNVATKAYVASEIAKIDFDNKDIDLSNYYTKEEVDAKIPSLDGYATTEYVDGEVTELRDLVYKTMPIGDYFVLTGTNGDGLINLDIDELDLNTFEILNNNAEKISFAGYARFEGSSYSGEITRDSLGSREGDITSLSVTLPDSTEYIGWSVISVTGTRGYSEYRHEKFDTYELFGYYIGIDYTMEYSDPSGNIHTKTEQVVLDYEQVLAPDYMDDWFDDSNTPLRNVEAYVIKNLETEQFFQDASSFDLRTQSIDRQLKALVEEHKAKQRRYDNSTTE